MSRRRSSDPAIPVSIAIPRSLHTRMNELLAYKQSRSKWVCDAIKLKLDRKLPEIDEYALPTLIMYAKRHKDAPKWLIRELSYYLKSISKTLAEETEEEQ